MRPESDARGVVDDLLELYSIDALDPRETQEFESALQALSDLDRVNAVARIRQTRDAVGRMAAEVAAVPPAGVRERILDTLGTETQSAGPAARPISPSQSVELPVGAASDPAESPSRPVDELAARRLNRRRRIALSVTSAAAAVVLVVGGVFIGRSTVADPGPGGSVVAQSDSFDQLRDVMSASDATVHRTELTGIRGTVVVASSRSMDRAVVLLDDAPQPPQQREYQLWLIGNDHAPRPAGLVDGAATKRAIVVTDLAGSRTVGMTVEPTGGSQQPTGEVLAAVTI